MNHSALQKLTVVVLMFATLLVTTPVSASELTSKTALGSITGVGSVELRGLTIASEGTLFAGDQVSVGSKSGAKIALANGQKIVLDQLTTLTFAPGGQVQVSKGNVGFSSKSGKLDIVAGQFQIQGDRELTGNVAFVGKDSVGLRVNTGSATVTDLKTQKIHTLKAGQVMTFNTTGAQQVALNLPSAITTVPAAPQMNSGRGLTGTGWAAILATVGGAAVAIGVLATRGDDGADAAAAAAVVAKQKATTALAATTAALTTGTTNAAAIETATTAVNSAIAGATNLTPAVRATLTAQATSIQSNIIASRNQIAQLNIRITALNAQLLTADSAAVATITAQINSLIGDVNATASQLNAQLNLLSILVQAAQTNGVQNVPNPPQITIIPTVPPTASASIPQ